MLVDRSLPAQIFLDCERVALAGFLETQQPAAHRRHDLGLAANHPALGPRRGKIRYGKRTAIGPDDIVHAGTQLTVHTLLDGKPTHRREVRPARLRLA